MIKSVYGTELRRSALCRGFHSRAAQLFLNLDDLKLNVIKILLICMSFVSLIYELNIELSLFVSLNTSKKGIYCFAKF